MRQGRPRRSHYRRRQSLFPAGFSLAVMGTILLLMAFMLGGSGVLASARKLFLFAGWQMLGAGAALVFLHVLLSKRAASAQKEQRPQLNQSSAPSAGEKDEDAPPGPRPSQWSAEVFAQIEWRRFEAVCEKLFVLKGFETRSKPFGPDDGVDIWLHSPATRLTVPVQCKHWKSTQVGIKEVREFLGVMAACHIKRGIYATTSRFSDKARQFARANGISALDGGRLLAMIQAQTPQQQQQLLDVALQGEYWKPTCASCGHKMARKKTGNVFSWQCKCGKSQPIFIGKENAAAAA